MLIKTKHPSLGATVIVVRQQTQDRLATKCFRGKPANRAGNFLRWQNAHELFESEFVTQSILADVSEAYAKKSRTNSVCIDFGSHIGWSGTDDLGKYKTEDLERFEPNRRSWALRVNLGSGGRLPAPPTSFLTIVYEIREEPGQVAVIVHSMYPGKDIGELVGNITERENCVFFDWEHPGAT
jgi:hypothetical protein